MMTGPMSIQVSRLPCYFCGNKIEGTRRYVVTPGRMLAAMHHECYAAGSVVLWLAVGSGIPATLDGNVVKMLPDDEWQPREIRVHL